MDIVDTNPHRLSEVARSTFWDGEMGSCPRRAATCYSTLVEKITPEIDLVIIACDPGSREAMLDRVLRYFNALYVGGLRDNEAMPRVLVAAPVIIPPFGWALHRDVPFPIPDRVYGETLYVQGDHIHEVVALSDSITGISYVPPGPLRGDLSNVNQVWHFLPLVLSVVDAFVGTVEGIDGNILVGSTSSFRGRVASSNQTVYVHIGNDAPPGLRINEVPVVGDEDLFAAQIEAVLEGEATPYDQCRKHMNFIQDLFAVHS